MTMIALLMVPWVNKMKEINVVPRVLADDLMFTAYGTGHRANTVRAMEISRDFFGDIGAKIADKKCFTFASDSYTRKFLSKYKWDSNGLTIPNVNNFRDLGTHLNLGKTPNGVTLTERMRKATNMAKKLR